MYPSLFRVGLLLTLGLVGSVVFAREYPIGKPQQGGGMEVSAMYLQPIKMEPAGMMRAAEASDVHMESDIRALANNVNGFPEGSWVPYLNVKYELSKTGGTATISGDFMAMVASDGPHYGDNVKLQGPGKYHLKLIISAPDTNPMAHFGRHVDKETGVGPWFKPFTTEYDFVYAGIGKKGGY